MAYLAKETRYAEMPYRRAGESGLKLPAVSLGLWHNFGGVTAFESARRMLLGAFDLGITHFDLANNYGPPAGAAEETLGRVLRSDLAPYRDELVISTKAGYTMWPGPYGDWGSKKYMLASLNQSLARMGLDYVDIFYHHRPDPETPMEESMEALATAVRQGKALYVGVSKYGPEETKRAAKILGGMGVKLLANQTRYNLLDREMEQGLTDALDAVGAGATIFSPLAQGVLTGRYLEGIPKDSRAGSGVPFLRPEHLTDALLGKVKRLREIAEGRGQTLAQMALSWVLRLRQVSSVIIGASRMEQIEENVGAALGAGPFETDEMEAIEKALDGA